MVWIVVELLIVREKLCFSVMMGLVLLPIIVYCSLAGLMKQQAISNYNVEEYWEVEWKFKKLDDWIWSLQLQISSLFGLSNCGGDFSTMTSEFFLVLWARGTTCEVQVRILCNLYHCKV